MGKADEEVSEGCRTLVPDSPQLVGKNERTMTNKKMDSLGTRFIVSLIDLVTIGCSSGDERVRGRHGRQGLQKIEGLLERSHPHDLDVPGNGEGVGVVVHR
jgi:hypothetical protein